MLRALILAAASFAFAHAAIAQAVITPDNASKLARAGEFPLNAYRIRLGPKKGELTLLEYGEAVQVVDDVKLAAPRKLEELKQPVDFAFSPDGRYVAWNERRSSVYKVFDSTSGKTHEIEIGPTPGNAAFSPDGKLLAIGNSVWDPKAEGVGYSEMHLYDEAGKLVRTLERTGPGALTPVFSSDGRLLAVGNRNDVTQIFEVASGKLLHKLDRKMTQEIALSPDDKLLACGYVDGMVMLWNVETGQPHRAAISGANEIYSVAWSPKGDLLATSGLRGKIILWDRELGKLNELDAPPWVIQARFTADGTRLFTASAADNTGKPDRKITAWMASPEK